MVTKHKGSIFSTTAPVIVNPVNCVGVSGAGLALEFKKRMPSNYEKYKEACNKELLRPGFLFPVSMRKVKIINAATKGSFKDKTNPLWIANILGKLARAEYPSIAMPYVGAGLGGMQPTMVEYLITEIFEDHPTTVELWEFDRDAADPLYTTFLGTYHTMKAKGYAERWLKDHLKISDIKTVIAFAESPTGSIHHLFDRIAEYEADAIYSLSQY